VEKVTAIVSVQTQKLHGTTVQTDDYRDQDGRWHSTTTNVPFSGTQATVLAQHLSFPPKPKVTANHLWSTVAFITGGLAMLLSICTVAAALFTGGISLFLTFLVLPGALMFLGIGWAVRVAEDNKLKNQALQVRAATERWEKSLALYKKLYYCYRDDTIFIPGSNSTVPAAGMLEFIGWN
jgi:hypothetical protein